MMKKYKYNFYLTLLVITLVLIPIVLLYGLMHPPSTSTGEEGISVPEDVYHLSERTVAEFQPVIVEKFNEQSELVVYSVELAEPVDLKQTGVIDWSVLNKTQTLTYRGIANFYIDMSSLGEKNISLDTKKNVVIIEIPHTKLAPVEIDPDKFEAGETQKGFLAFGELRFTPKEYNNLEQEVKQKIYRAADTQTHWKSADEAAVKELKKLYDPVVKMVDNNYSVEIAFLK